MGRIETAFKSLNTAGKKALIPYLAAGFPSLKESLQLLHAAVESGADLIELGVPFSDPVADGPVIQAVHQEALKQGTTLKKSLELVAEFRKSNQHTPIILMGYANPVFALGEDEFIRLARDSGVDAVLLVDVPFDEGETFYSKVKAAGMDTIFLVTPTTRDDRLQELVQHASGYLYYVSIKGVTGSDILDTKSVATAVAKLKAITSLPVAVGFGIKDANTAAEIAKHADGIIIATAFLKNMLQNIHSQQDHSAYLKTWLAPVRQAIDGISITKTEKVNL